MERVSVDTTLNDEEAELDFDCMNEAVRSESE